MHPIASFHAAGATRASPGLVTGVLRLQATPYACRHSATGRVFQPSTTGHVFHRKNNNSYQKHSRSDNILNTNSDDKNHDDDNDHNGDGSAGIAGWAALALTSFFLALGWAAK